MSKIKERMLEPMIVKVQQSLFSSDNKKIVLIYNEDKSIYTETSNNVFVDKILEVLKDRPKAYLNVQLGMNDINILEEVEKQNW